MGGLAGLLKGSNHHRSSCCETNRNHHLGPDIDGSAAALGAYVGWSAGSWVSLTASDPDASANPLPGFLAAATMTTLGLVTAHYTERDVVYWPFGALGLFVTAALAR
jgi:hypothetical protein